MRSALILVALLLANCTSRAASPSPSPTATWPPNTREPLLPTVPGATLIPRRPSPTPRPTLPPAPQSSRPAPLGLARFHGQSLRQRVGVTLLRSPSSEDVTAFGFGWYLNWTADANQVGLPSEYWPMVRVSATGYWPGEADLLAALGTLPGAVWLIGNEPDVRWQDNVTPEQYAARYHDLYTFLKTQDPTCLVAIGGVAQPTALRLQYLDRVLVAYRQAYGLEMPVDVWNVHAFLLREERNSWGIDIPPGFPEVSQGDLLEIEQHDDLNRLRTYIRAFRTWLAEHGQRNKPLVITEYGILMPVDFGFTPERVGRFLVGSFDLFRNLADPDTGYPEDENHLVQRWAWYSLNDQSTYPTGSLRDADGGINPLGETWRRYFGLTSPGGYGKILFK